MEERGGEETNSTHLASTVRMRNGLGAMAEMKMVRAGPRAIRK
jgi:hypothetical protein